MAIAWAVLAALVFTAGGYFTKLSEGLTRAAPAATMFALFLAGAALQAIAMRARPMAVTYVMVLGLEAMAAFALGVFVLGESSSLTRLAGVGLVVAGIVLLEV